MPKHVNTPEQDDAHEASDKFAEQTVFDLVDCEACRGTGVADSSLRACLYCGGRGYYDGFHMENSGG